MSSIPIECPECNLTYYAVNGDEDCPYCENEKLRDLLRQVRLFEPALDKVSTTLLTTDYLPALRSDIDEKELEQAYIQSKELGVMIEKIRFFISTINLPEEE